MQIINRQCVLFNGLRRRLFLLATSVSMILLGMVSGCNQPSATTPGQTTASKNPEVKVVRPEKKDVRRPIERPGYNIEAYERTPLYARISGYVRKWSSDMGDHVSKDAVLAELYVPEMDVELKQKEASMRQASAEIEQAKTVILRAQAELERAQSQYARLAQAGRGGLLGKDEVDEYRLGFEAAQAALAKAKADVSVAEARLDVAKADRDHVETLLQYTKIRAPYDGVVTQRRINTGDLVQPAKGDALFIVEKVDPVRVFVNVQELEAVWVRDGDTAVIRPQSLQGQEFRGKVTRNSGALHPQNRTLRTEIDLPNTEGKLLPGMYVTVTITAERKNVWVLPAAAVVTQGDQTFCYRMDNGKAVRTPIEVGLRSNELVEVVKKQTKPAPAQESRWEDFTGEEVIVASAAASLTDGQAVTVTNRP
jgi:RND family efflux transporter MFP subunit